ncbi:MAG: DUF3592 domain-containing protein [Candidatus Heimdallarchaeota archaeon]|nr:DUF3592 domain-containing protein [Candidatus Heimdallarchaeota archaeon]
MVFLLSLTYLIYCGYFLLPKYQTDVWNSTIGDVTSTTILFDDEDLSYNPIIYFEYSVGGHIYENSHLFDSQKDKVSAEEKINEYIINKNQVVVYYNPNNPSASTLEEGKIPMYLLLSRVIGYPISIFSLIIWIADIKKLKKSEFIIS